MNFSRDVETLSTERRVLRAVFALAILAGLVLASRPLTGSWELASFVLSGAVAFSCVIFVLGVILFAVYLIQTAITGRDHQ